MVNATARRNTVAKLRRYRLMYLMMLPGICFTALFAYVPLYGLYMAFSKFQLGTPILSSPFVGLSVFKEFIGDSLDLLYLLRNTLGMNLISLFVCLLGALMLAVLLNEVKIPLIKKTVQTASFFPFFISWVIVYNIFNVFFAVENGVVNATLVNIGVLKDGINFLGEPRYAWAVIVATNLWKSIGYNSVIFLAAISGIDQEIYEAAEVDGADRLQRMRYITLPSLMPTVQVLLILNVGWIFSSNFDQYYLFTNGMNRPMMEVFDMYIYRFGIKQLNYSYATAVGITQSLAGVVLILIVNALSKRFSGKGIF